MSRYDKDVGQEDILSRYDKVVGQEDIYCVGMAKMLDRNTGIALLYGDGVCFL
jgi:hypothetical protein